MNNAKLIVIAVCLGALLILLGGLYLFISIPTTEAVPEVPTEAAALPLPAVIELADTAEKRTQGLSGRASVEDNYGMLFVFPVEASHGFWMKDMRVSIDIVWMADDGRIVHIEHNLSPDSYPEVIAPPAPARYVLETRAGYAKEQGWEVGMMLDVASYAS